MTCWGGRSELLLGPQPPRAAWLLGKGVPLREVLVLGAIQIFGQQLPLSPSSAITTLGLRAARTLSASTRGDLQPAILEWTMQYLADLTAANVGKIIICSYEVSAVTCLAWGENKTTIPDGALATATLQISPAIRNSSIAIVKIPRSASDCEGTSLPVTRARGAINLILPHAISCARICGPRLLNQYFSSQSSVTAERHPKCCVCGAAENGSADLH
jgi:hypothetical protein